MKTVLPAPKSAWIVLVTALSAHVLLISVAATHRTDTSLLRAWMLEILAPMEKLVDRTGEGVSGVWGAYVDLRGVYRQNARLQAEINDLRMKAAASREELLEAARLRRDLGFADSGIGKVVFSRVIGRDASTGRQTLTIDRGRSSGIETGQAVVTPDGVAGRIIVASNFASLVQTLVDVESAVGVLVGERRQQGIVRGNGSRFLELDYIEDDTELKEGDILVTSGLDGVHQKGLPVGTIASVGPRDAGGLYPKVLIRPSVDFGRLEEVICVVEQPPAMPDITPENTSGIVR
ncbi:MAG TPA: rod shape-determining protein MreC [Terriglobia bacterium]|nr:rod shape-determining protein MreC [Terriglobia bacterium]